MQQKFERLLSPGLIGRMETKNRIVMPGMIRSYATPEGYVTPQVVEHYATAARGGAGLIIVEACFVQKAGKLAHQQIGIDDDKCVPGLVNLTEAVKIWGSKIAVQIANAGRATTTSITGMPVVAPSVIPWEVLEGIPRELTTEEVSEMVEAFAQAAGRAKQAGFDAVEVHAAHGYIISQFLSPYTNRRTDKYGGDLNGRMTFLLEVLQRVRAMVGDDFPIIVRLNAEDLVDGGLQLSDTIQIARRLEAVRIDALHVSAGILEARLNPRAHGCGGLTLMYEPRGPLVSQTAEIKKSVSLPVIGVGALTPEMGEEILQQGKADFIAMGRQLLADPEIPNKVRRDKRKDIRPCIRCNVCLGLVGIGVRCTANAQLGHETDKMIPAAKRKKVLIAGGGPAGMEAARIAAMRGHDVTIYEKNEKLGGHLLEAAVPDFKKDLRDLRDWMTDQIAKLGVKLELGKEITPAIADKVRPDALVIATGSAYAYPKIPGLKKAIVSTASDILLGKAIPGKKTIVAGGGVVGCETALYLAQQGKKPTIVEALPELATDEFMSRGLLITLLMDNEVEILTNLKIIAVTDNGITAIDSGQNIVNVIGDKIALAMGLTPQTRLYEELKGRAYEVYSIGDSSKPRRVGDAIREGYKIGSLI